MGRTGLLIALVAGAVVGLVFAIFPQLDLALSRILFDAGNPGFTPGMMLKALREIARWLVVLIAAPAFLAVLLKFFYPQRPMIVPARATLLMIATLAIGPGLTSNVIFKDHWHRPRPAQVTEFGGNAQFVPWWDPRGSCRTNCSFVAGEPSGAFWTIAAASYAPPPLQPLAYAAAVTFGLSIGLVRMAAGGHFFSDVAFAGLFTFLIIWLAHATLYRWARTRTSDAAIEQWLARLSPFNRKKN
jgi:membrane-associated PAP2 superfamily phosphatase